MNKRELLRGMLTRDKKALIHLRRQAEDKAMDKMLKSMSDAELDAYIKHLERQLGMYGVDVSKLQNE